MFLLSVYSFSLSVIGIIYLIGNFALPQFVMLKILPDSQLIFPLISEKNIILIFSTIL